MMTCKFVAMLALLAIAACASSHPSGRPLFFEKERFARWLVHYADWGVVSTTSVKHNGVAYGSVLSFSDGVGIDNSTGTPYLYITEWDESGQDLAVNANATLTITEEAVWTGTGDKTCGTFDPEDPNCAKLNILGRCVKVEANDIAAAKDILFSRHPQMKEWPANHGFAPYKFEIDSVILLDFYGGATVIDAQKYYAASPWTN